MQGYTGGARAWVGGSGWLADFSVQDVTCPAVPVDSAWSGRWYLQKRTGVEGRGYSSITQGFSFNPSRVSRKTIMGIR